MTTLWWIVVLWLACCACLVFGFILRGEFELWARASRSTPEPIDFTRRGVGS